MNKQGSNSNSNYPSIVEKEKGDKEFKEKNYEKALQFYSQALNIQPENSILYSNRSTVYFHLGNFQASLQDAEKCIQLDPQWIKV